MKRCFRCTKSKPIADFGRHKGRPDGLQAECKVCGKKRAAADRSERRKDPKYAEYMRWYFMRVNYGITREQYEQLLAEQEGKCRICAIPDSSARRPGKTVAGLDPFGLCVDHDHKTGIIRGLLCNACNRGLGLFKDSTETLNRAHQYLKTSGACLPGKDTV